MAFMEAVSLDPSNYVINRTSIRNQCNIFRKKCTEKIKENFSKLNAQVITVHWDTKLLHDLTGRPVERLSIIGYKPIELKRLCLTRWSSQVYCCKL